MTAFAPDNRPLCGQKRRRGATEEENQTIAVSQSLENGTKRRCHSQYQTKTKYWDSLSKVWLTRRALAEIDRRNRQKASPVESVRTYGLNLGNDPGQLKHLKRFARYGGPDIRELRGYQEPSKPNLTAKIMPSTQSKSRSQSNSDAVTKTTTSKTKKTSPYDANFEQNLIDNGIYPDDHDFADDRDPPVPNNQAEISGILSQSRLSLSESQFSNQEFRVFKQTNSRAINEDAVMADVFPLIQGTTRIPSAKNLVFGNLQPITDGTLVDAKPDFYDGTRPTEINLQIRESLGSYIVPATQRHAPVLPNFFFEAKGPNGSPAVAKRQACYDGALGARGIHSLRSYETDPALAYDNNAYTITSTYQFGYLILYTVHPTKSTDPKNPSEYHMVQLGAFAMIHSVESFREGATAFRNARDWAKLQRDNLIAAAHSRLMGVPQGTSMVGASTHSSISKSTAEPDAAAESETSADELAIDAGRRSSLPNKRLKTGTGESLPQSPP